MQIRSIQRVVILLSLIASSVAADTIPDFDEDGPFREGEGFGNPATCDTIGDWIDRVPEYDGRISMTITGEIVESHWDGALAYLIMCEPEEVQVMCITYSPAEVNGETIMFAGGYNRSGERQVVLDPCLVFPNEASSDLK
ncbi:hypothetical protein [Tropicimonas isoalkanivorans]|uniref:Uncharacterized protein n=1 Tax=Tropicimonas isoalkanivorans TaxID=441112 RepID=A0A1I1R152_9RHOB|nr:hypothetical protein [Tropicimonas isoalkanivorans]SFD25273.1 hypothetical protein SAMN04488094_12339 [Tropicimonas isoalkanivorans]